MYKPSCVNVFIDIKKITSKYYQKLTTKKLLAVQQFWHSCEYMLFIFYTGSCKNWRFKVMYELLMLFFKILQKLKAKHMLPKITSIKTSKILSVLTQLLWLLFFVPVYTRMENSKQCTHYVLLKNFIYRYKLKNRQMLSKLTVLAQLLLFFEQTEDLV